MEYIPISQVEAAVEAGVNRLTWVPMFDGTGLCIAFAYKNNEETAWYTFQTDPGNYLIH